MTDENTLEMELNSADQTTGVASAPPACSAAYLHQPHVCGGPPEVQSHRFHHLWSMCVSTHAYEKVAWANVETQLKRAGII